MAVYEVVHIIQTLADRWQLRFMSSLEAMLMMRKEPKPQQVHHTVINELERLERHYCK